MKTPSMLTAIFVLALVACSDDDASGVNNQNNGNTGAVCGNGEREGMEECDDGTDNSDTAPDACRSNCVNARCGDGAVDTGEECDQGAQNSDDVPDACRDGCVDPYCGDGVVDTAHDEICDDGNDHPGDGCDASCQPEFVDTTTPNLLSPVDTVLYEPGDVTLIWTLRAGATHYLVEIADEPTFATPLAAVTVEAPITTLSFPDAVRGTPALTAAVTYWWRVRSDITTQPFQPTYPSARFDVVRDHVAERVG